MWKLALHKLSSRGITLAICTTSIACTAHSSHLLQSWTRSTNCRAIWPSENKLFLFMPASISLYWNNSYCSGCVMVVYAQRGFNCIGLTMFAVTELAVGSKPVCFHTSYLTPPVLVRHPIIRFARWCSCKSRTSHIRRNVLFSFSVLTL